MVHDYYHTLGIEPSADSQTIEAASRQKAKSAHPDCGGSHEQMLLLNEAWEILSNPTLRARYDRMRTNAGSAEFAKDAADDAQHARDRARHYPENWKDFEQWRRFLRQDAAQAEYASARALWPTAGRSISGHACIVAGGILGPVLPILVLFIRYGPRFLKPLMSDESMRGPLLASTVVPMLALSATGAIAGARLHRWIRQRILSSKRPLASGGMTRTINCPKCGQKLRLPSVAQELTVTCNRCKNKFDAEPNAPLPPFPGRQLVAIGVITLIALLMPEISVWLTRPADREYIRAVARIMQTCDAHADKESDNRISPQESAEEWFQQHQAAMSVKNLSSSGVTEALVNAADAWSDAEVAYLNERLNRLSNDPQTERTILLGADTVKMRRNGFEDTMGLGLERLFQSEYGRAKSVH
jgi:hypothetical protein